MSGRGRFVTFEGIDGAGKSSHVEWFAERLRERGRTVVVTREPGGTELAEAVRDWVLNRPMSMRVEALLVFAARQDHLDRVIRPALAAGTWVVCDRFTDSTVAYQGGGRGMPADDIALLERWVHPDLQPDRTYLFDLDPAEAARRRQAARAADRFEAQDEAFFGRVRGAYRARAAESPERFRRIDGARTIDSIRAELEEDLATL
ncbi:MAG: dTMP kinase [Burkholderiaceae bacterium]|nr:dTMP kinase [Burkholderiales bacterium]MCZ8102215.1 dTMP kinase [Burkholderiales bacterium]MCZ8337011.1 dTMP kinase [Burkholderiaceae bacterium]